jgi:hypothetical protein
MYKLIIAGLAVLAVGLLAMGCGGGSDQATAQVSEAQFTKQVKATCAKSQKEIEVVVTGQSPEGIDPIQRLASLLKQEAEQLDALAGPEKAEARIEPLIDNVLLVSGIIAQKGKDAFSDPRVAAYQREADELHLTDC